MKKKLPELKTDNEAEDFIDTADLTEYDLSALVLMISGTITEEDLRTFEELAAN